MKLWGWSQTNKLQVVLSVVILGIASALVFFIYFHESSNRNLAGDLEAVATLSNRQANFDEFAQLFVDIAQRGGGAYAFSVMREAVFPFGLDLHLLGHEVGDILYEQEGIAGMKVCTHDFRNACSHTIVIGALLDYGTGAFDDIREACYQAPGGKGAYTMCFHGLGHGVFAFNGYDFEKTIAMCDQLGTQEYNHREAIECFGGAVMEVIGGGGHDREVWEVMREKYLQPEDPFALCASDIVPEPYKPMCYNYITPYAFEALGADMAYPDPSIYAQTFKLCEQISLEKVSERDACFGGVGKELIGIATGRNFTPGFEPQEEHLTLMRDWCMLAGPEDGQVSCVAATMNSLYWGGERPFATALSFCQRIPNKDLQTPCIEGLTRNVRFYIDDEAYYRRYCQSVPSDYQPMCEQQLLR